MTNSIFDFMVINSLYCCCVIVYCIIVKYYCVGEVQSSRDKQNTKTLFLCLCR